MSAQGAVSWASHAVLAAIQGFRMLENALGCGRQDGTEEQCLSSLGSAPALTANERL